MISICAIAIQGKVECAVKYNKRRDNTILRSHHV